MKLSISECVRVFCTLLSASRFLSAANDVALFLLQKKAYRRGLSVKKSKKNREYPSMKVIGVKNVDETFRVSYKFF